MAENIPAWKRVQSINRTVTLPPELREFFLSLANSTRRLLEAIDSPVADPQTPYGEQRVASLMLNTLAVMEHFGPDGLRGTGRTVRESIEAGEPDGVVIGELLPAALAIKSACDELREHWRFDGRRPASGDYTEKEYCWGDPVPTGTRDKLEYGARTIEAILVEPAEPGSDTDGDASKPTAKPTVNDRMMQLLDDDSRRVELTASEWAELLSCDASSVKKTACWKEIQATRKARQKALKKGGFAR